MSKYIISVLLVVLLVIPANAQKKGKKVASNKENTTSSKVSKKTVSTIEVSSILIDINGKPIKGAEVSSKEGKVFTFTNIAGVFKLNIPANAPILIESDGYESKSISIQDIKEKITLEKMPFLSGKEDVVYLPFGFRPTKKTIVGSVVSVKPKNSNTYDNTQYIYDALMGRVAGMTGNQNIHGMDNAVFVVDGIAGRDVSSLTLEEIDQVTVLKDANAAALYGVQSQNGVILITTKRGQANKGRISFNAESGLSYVKALPKYLNGADYMTYYNLARKNDGLTTPLYDSTTIANTRNGSNPYKYPDVNYYNNQFIGDFRPFKSVRGEFSGGNDNTQYYLNMGWTNTGSILNLGEGKNQVDNRFNLRANVDFRINDFITSNLNVATVLDFSKAPNTNFWSLASTLRPNAYSLLIPVNQVQNQTDIASAKRYGDYILGGTAINPSDNMYGEMLYSGQNKTNNRTVQVNQGFKFDLSKLVQGLSVNTNVSFDLFNTYSNITDNKYAIYESKWLQKKVDLTDSLVVTKIGTDIQTGNQTIPAASVNLVRKIGANVVANYARTFNDNHAVFASAIAYVNSIEQNDTLLDKYYPHLGVQLNYGYKQKYLVDFSTSYVTSVKLKAGNRGQFSPTIGIAWVASEEDFLKSLKSLDYLKLRASAGIIKSDLNIDRYYIYENTFNSGTAFPWADAGRTGNSTVFNNLANPIIDYEKRNNINIGFEASLFDKSLWIEANAFQNRYTGLIGKMTNLYPAFMGGFNPTVNYGEELYQGFDLGINYTKQIGDFAITLGGNMTYKQSEVIKKDELYLDSYQNRVGKPIDAIFGLQNDGLYKESDFANVATSTLLPGLPVPAFGTVKPGDIKYKNQNSDNIVDSKDEVMIGNFSPDIYFGVNLNLSYKGFSIFAQLTGQNGAEKNLNGNYYWVYGNTMKYSERVLGAWNVDMTDEQKATATYPRITSTSSTNNFRASDYWLIDNNYMNLQRVQITYDLPKSFVPKLGMRGLSIYMRGSNLLTIAKNAGIRDLNIGTEPQYRNFSAGLRANF